jgi:hypothetical protein
MNYYKSTAEAQNQLIEESAKTTQRPRRSDGEKVEKRVLGGIIYQDIQT